MPDLDSDDEHFLLTADLDYLVWSEEPMPDSWEYLCIHEIPIPATKALQPNQMALPAMPSLQPNQVEMPQEPELMESDILEDILGLIDIPEEILSDSDTWTHSVLDYKW